MTRHTHIVGIGGAGMHPIAKLLHEQGEDVSGCDRTSSELTAQLAELGVTTFSGHAPEHLATADRLLVTSALPSDHPEIQAAHTQGIPVITRHDLWREWSSLRPVIAVSGTHGKTTTTAMIATIFSFCAMEAGFLVGSVVPALGTNARWGSGPLILEADEYARTFLALEPHTAVITNIDWDHVDIYPTQASYDEAYHTFLTNTHLKRVILCGDDPGIQRVAEGIIGERCGLEQHNHWRATDIVEGPEGTDFMVLRHEQPFGKVHLPVSGIHNVRNALLALATAAAHDIPIQDAIAALAHFTGTQRRFERKGEAGGISVYDDYAHHPAEIAATLAAARARFGERRIIAYFQPHTFSRLEAFRTDFLQAFSASDIVRIGAVYGAREAKDGDPTVALAADIVHRDAAAVGDISSAVEALRQIVKPGDVVLTMGAGDGVQVGERLLEQLHGL